jgi:hypothetical protein
LHPDINGLAAFGIFQAACFSRYDIGCMRISPTFDWQTRFGCVLERGVSEIECKAAMHFAFFSPALSGGFDRLIVPISRFLSGFRTAL